MRKKIVLLFLVLSIIILAVAFLLFNKNIIMSHKDDIKIIDATYSCFSTLEKFYEDDEYIYYFPCKKSDSVYVKLNNNTKMLVTEALSEEKVSIKELISAGLEVKKKKK